MASVPSDIEVRRLQSRVPSPRLPRELGLGPDEILPYGHTKAKITMAAIRARTPKGKLVLVTGINPTPAGEGKSTVTVGVSQALCRLGKKAVVCIRSRRSARSSA